MQNFKKFDILFDDSWSKHNIVVNRNIGADLTLLTIGDSWVWGDELGGCCSQTSYTVQENNYRLEHCFGNILFQKIKLNWVQMALPGAGNEWIVTEAEKLSKQLTPLAENVIMIVCFSDHFRGIDGNVREQNCIKDIMNSRSIFDALSKIEIEYYQRLEAIATQYKNLKVIATSAFTDSIIRHRFQTEKTWVEIILPSITKPCYLHTSGAWNLNEFLKKEKMLSAQYMEDMNNYLLPSMGLRQQEMLASGLFYPRCHPKEHGHELWAEYLYRKITEVYGVDFTCANTR